MASYRVFTISSGTVSEGAEIEEVSLKGAGITIPAIIIGEEGRGRERGLVPVGNPPMIPCPERKKEVYSSSGVCGCGVQLDDKKEGSHIRYHSDTGVVQGKLMFAEVGTTKAGKPKFFSQLAPNSDEKIVVVFRTKMGFRGGNSHTGDRQSWKCSKFGCDTYGDGATMPEVCPKCGATGGWDGGPKLSFAPFPGERIVSGQIAQGDAGRMGSGEQIIALIPKGVVFRTSYSGRLYGAPAAHYYKWNGEKLIAATWDERAAADLF